MRKGFIYNLMKKIARNTNIEFFRFLYTFAVVMAHAGSVYGYDYLRGAWRGHIAVEFFFVLSGYLMTASAAKQKETGSLGESTAAFMYKKWRGLAPVWYTALTGYCVLWLMDHPVAGFSGISEFAARLVPSLLMLSSHDMEEIVVMSYSWYIPVMMITMLLLYPLIRKWGKSFTCIAAPLIVIFYCSWAMHTYGKLLLLKQDWYGFFYPQTIRGIGDMCMGCIAYEISDMLRKRYAGRFTSVGRNLVTAFSIIMLGLPYIWLVVSMKGSEHPCILLMFCLGIALAFGGIGQCDRENKMCSFLMIKDHISIWLGKISLGIYLSQGLVQKLFTPAHMEMYGVGVYVTLCIVMGILLTYLSMVLNYFAGILCRSVKRLCVLTIM